MATPTEPIRTKSLEKLNDKQATAFKKVLKEAAKNKFLGGDEEEVIPKRRCIVILYGKEEDPIGFYAPKKQNVRGVDHWRSGIVFVLPGYQGKGIMSKVLTDFFATHQPGLAWIEDTNDRSIALFKGLGFKKDKPRTDDENHPGHWWVREKTKAALESYSW